MDQVLGVCNNDGLCELQFAEVCVGGVCCAVLCCGAMWPPLTVSDMVLNYTSYT